MKKHLSIFIAMALLLVGSLGTAPTFAASSSLNKIPVEEYFTQVKAEYAKYGIEYDVVKYGTVKEVSKKVLDDGLAEVKKFGELYERNRAEEKARINTIKEDLAKGSILQSDVVTPKSSMFIDKTFKYDSAKSYLSGLLKATIRMTVVVTCEANNKDFITVKSIKTKQYGTAVEFESWTETDQGYSLTSETLYAWATGDLKFKYTEPRTGSTITQTYEEEVGHLWGSNSI